uniref:Glycosyltransferase n=1 Tax=Chenopodium quinoa TaxID=63459 RepID=A0A803LGZ2_CHEQI
MGSEPEELHVVLFPFMAHGHMIPTLDIARLFAARDGVKATIITTPLNVAAFTKAIGSRKEIEAPTINIEAFRFPAQEAGLPEGMENLEQVLGSELMSNFFKATEMLSEQLEQYLEKVRPNCLVSDMFFTWTTDIAARFNIPRLVFHGTSSFSLCAQEVIRLHEPFNNVSSDEETFVIPYFPHAIQMTSLQISEELRSSEDSEYKRRTANYKESELKSYGVIVNSFYELEPDYADFFRIELGRRAWNIGPVSLSNRSIEDKVQRGKQASIDEHECLKWLNSKKPDSVIYICFGSTASLIAPQLHEIAMAVLILEHEAIGGFVTHCGWNSTVEGISAGVPMVTWPIFAEQFYNEKLVTHVLKTGVSVGAKKWSRTPSLEYLIKQEAIEKALTEIMVGKEAEERRTRAKKLKEMSRKSVEEGGSSYSDLSALINELRDYHLKTPDNRKNKV